MSKTILVTGFEPFGEDSLNPSWEAVLRLPDQIHEFRVVKRKLPTVFGESLAILEDSIREHRPSLVLSVGVAGGRSSISVERIAINLDDARIPDNDGNTPIDKAIDPEGPPACFSTLPIKAIVTNLRAQEIPASVSNTAGTFVCNHVMYGALNYLRKSKINAKAGFIHVPYLHEQVVDRPNLPSMSRSMLIRSLKLIIETAVKYDQDLQKAEGALH